MFQLELVGSGSCTWWVLKIIFMFKTQSVHIYFLKCIVFFKMLIVHFASFEKQNCSSCLFWKTQSVRNALWKTQIAYIEPFVKRKAFKMFYKKCNVGEGGGVRRPHSIFKSIKHSRCAFLKMRNMNAFHFSKRILNALCCTKCSLQTICVLENVPCERFAFFEMRNINPSFLKMCNMNTLHFN